jgi:hypothetical protein
MSLLFFLFSFLNVLCMIDARLKWLVCWCMMEENQQISDQFPQLE